LVQACENVRVTGRARKLKASRPIGAWASLLAGLIAMLRLVGLVSMLFHGWLAVEAFGSPYFGTNGVRRVQTAVPP
jgi:hypothetical protein